MRREHFFTFIFKLFESCASLILTYFDGEFCFDLGRHALIRYVA